MEFYDVRIGYEIGALAEAIIEPEKEGRGWVVQFRDTDNAVLPLTRGGHQRIFNDLDVATELVKGFGFNAVTIVEHF